MSVRNRFIGWRVKRKPRVRRTADQVIYRWISEHVIITQVLSVAGVSVPWLLIPFFGLTVAWWSLGFLLPAVYFLLQSVLVHVDEPEEGEG